MTELINPHDYRARDVQAHGVENATGERKDELLAVGFVELDSDEGRAIRAAHPDAGGPGPDVTIDHQRERDIQRRVFEHGLRDKTTLTDRMVGAGSDGQVERTDDLTPAVNTPSVGLTTAAAIPGAEPGDRHIGSGPETERPEEGHPLEDHNVNAAIDGDGGEGSYEDRTAGQLKDEVKSRLDDAESDEDDERAEKLRGYSKLKHDELVTRLEEDDELRADRVNDGSDD